MRGSSQGIAAQAVGPDDDSTVRFRELARELDMAFGVTYLERSDGKPRNTLSVVDGHAEIVLA